MNYGSQKTILGGERQLTLNQGGKLKAQGFDTRRDEDDFFPGARCDPAIYPKPAWMKLAGNRQSTGWYRPSWYGPGWYWDPYFLSYTYLPGDGIFYSPFGWGFYSPLYVYRSPYFFNGFYGQGSIDSVNITILTAMASSRAAVFDGGGFHGAIGGGGFHGGGVHAGGGGHR